MDLNLKYYSYNIYFYLLILVAVSLPLSMFAISVSIILLTLNWIVEGQFKKKFQILKQRKSILVFVSIYLLHVIGMLYSSEIGYGLGDLKIKLPLLLFPVIIGTSRPLNFSHLKQLIFLFVIAVIVSTMFSMSALLGLLNVEVIDIRDISVFV